MGLNLSKSRIFPFLVFGIMSLIALLTNYYGGADILDYSDGAKYFAGDYSAKIRSSHSYTYSLLNLIPVKLMQNFIFFKIVSLLSLAGLVYSVYRISGRNSQALWMMLLAPISWYMSPWISPIQLASLLFLWSYYYLKKYDSSNSLKNLFSSSILSGLAWAFWDGILFFIPLLMVSFLYDKKFSHFFYFILGALIGVGPRLIIDQVLFGFAIFGILRHIFASLAIAAYGGIYNQESLRGVSKFLISAVFFPLCTYILFKKRVFLENYKTVVFIILSILLIIVNSQIRFSLLIFPIIICTVIPYISKKEYFYQIAFSIILVLLVINPYIIQLGYETNLSSIELLPFLSENPYFSKDLSSKKILSDINQISQDYPNQVFVVGNSPESYRFLANIYWGDGVKEFVSLEDYNFYLEGKNTVFSKKYCPDISINERRKICSEFSIEKTDKDKTDYSSIIYAISYEENLDLEGFELVQKYSHLSLFKKST